MKGNQSSDYASKPGLQQLNHEELVYELVNARDEVHQLELQVSALLAVQQQMQEARWHREQAWSSASSRTGSQQTMSRLKSVISSQTLRYIKGYLQQEEWILLRRILGLTPKCAKVVKSDFHASAPLLQKRMVGAEKIAFHPPFSTIEDGSPRNAAKDKRLEEKVCEQAAEIEDLRAHVSTHSSTKQALVKKLTQVESALKSSLELRDQAQAQISSDKQVLFYLDKRVNLLESRCNEQEVAAKEAEIRIGDYKRQLKVLIDEKQKWVKVQRYLEDEVASLRVQLTQSEGDLREAALRWKNRTERS